MYIVRPTVEEEHFKAIMERVDTFITDQGGVIDKTEPWGRKRLAYPIEKHLEGQYVLSRFKAEPTITRELENSLLIAEDVIRHLLIRLDE